MESSIISALKVPNPIALTLPTYRLRSRTARIHSFLVVAGLGHVNWMGITQTFCSLYVRMRSFRHLQYSHTNKRIFGSERSPICFTVKGLRVSLTKVHLESSAVKRLWTLPVGDVVVTVFACSPGTISVFHEIAAGTVCRYEHDSNKRGEYM